MEVSTSDSFADNMPVLRKIHYFINDHLILRLTTESESYYCRRIRVFGIAAEYVFWCFPRCGYLATDSTDLATDSTVLLRNVIIMIDEKLFPQLSTPLNSRTK